MIIPFNGAAFCSRLAVFTVSPIAVISPVVPTTPSSAAPVLMPIRMAIVCSSGSAFNPGISLLLFSRISSACISSAARIACSASSSCAASAPHTAIMASPMCLSIRPRRWVIIRSSRSHNAFIRSVISSASICSASAVNPERSANKTVTIFRCWASCSASPCPAFNAASFCSIESSASSTTASPSTGRCASKAAIASSS